MKLKVKHFDETVFQEKLQHLQHLDFSLFVEDIPQNQEDLSSINIIVISIFFFTSPHVFGFGDASKYHRGC